MAAQNRPPTGIGAVIFDVDGVLVASPHERAWQQALADCMANEWHAYSTDTTYTPSAFTTAVYQEHVAGKPRLDGATALLEYFGVPQAAERAIRLAERKQELVNTLIERGEFEAFLDGVRLVQALRARGVCLGVASSSKNADRFMERVHVAAGKTLRDMFDANVCGRDLPHGKPDPEIFLLAARELGVPPARCLVVEDAASGIQAARTGGMLALGVARLNDTGLLEAAGADLVVTSLDAVAVDALVRGQLHQMPVQTTSADRKLSIMPHPPGPAGSPLSRWPKGALEATPDPAWVIEEHGYTPRREMGVESRFAVSNGFLGVRGARSASRGPTWVSWLHHLSWASWPRTFVAGLFDTPNTEPAVPALVPAPDWLRFRIVVDGSPLLLRTGELIAHRRTLDMRRGSLLVDWRHRDPRGPSMRLHALRAVSLAERSLGLQLVQFEMDQPGRITFEAWLEVTNAGLDVVQVQPSLGVWRTAESAKRLAVASAAELRLGSEVQAPTGQVHLTRIWSWEAVPGQVVTFWRLVSFARADGPDQTPALRAQKSLADAVEAGPQRVLEAHEHAWTRRWTSSDVRVDGDASAQRALRFAIYHLNSAANPDDEHVSIGARALTGDAYLGHVFWDTENYLLPFYTFTWPAAARALLMYRYHTLPAARAKAARMGYAGALYAWESADSGEETTPEMIVGPDGRSVAVLSGTLEQHISADIAYAIWQYWQATADASFLLEAGAEMLLETARFWASRADLEADGRYHIRDVIGLDEYHEHIDDNAFTNVMAQWNLERGLETAALVAQRWPEQWRELRHRLKLTVEDFARWRDVAARLVDGVDAETGLVEQFAGYFGLEDVDLAQFAGRTVPMDVVLGRPRTQASQVVKQADVVMLQALLPDRFVARAHARNFHYYEPRCGHGSSLSRAMHAIVAARIGDRQVAERYFRETAATDLDDVTAGIAGGVRIAALGGLWQAAIFGFAGLGLEDDGLRLEPRLPSTWEVLRFRAQWRGREVEIRLERATRLATATLRAGEPMRMHVDGRAHALEHGVAWHTHWNEPRELRPVAPAAA